jgi:hypothetical protein
LVQSEERVHVLGSLNTRQVICPTFTTTTPTAVTALSAALALLLSFCACAGRGVRGLIQSDPRFDFDQCTIAVTVGG